MLRSVYLNEEFRKKATGSDIAETLVKAVLEEIAKRGGTKVRLGVNVKAKGAIRLYAKLGFRKLSKAAAFFITKAPAFVLDWKIMEKDLINAG